MKSPLRLPRPWVLAATVAALLGAVLFAACGGSASESPWPVEPDTPILGEPEPGASGAPTSTSFDDGAADAGVLQTAVP